MRDENEETLMFLATAKVSLVLFVSCHGKTLTSRFADQSSVRIDNDMTEL